ncbi:MAG TPA: hypothetical protein VHF27_04810 [Acidimicrobiales bacterium]|nr:hypothetical protein [Acidimicrobiales bacterium]
MARRVVLAVLAGLMLAGGLGAGQASALPPRDRDPIDPPGDIDVPFTPPRGGFEWRVDSRFGARRDGMVDYHWNEAAGSRFPGPAYTYEPSYVRPTELNAKFDGCATEADAGADAGSTTYNYRWELRIPSDGAVIGTPTTARNCRWEHTFPLDPVTGKGTPTIVRLSITDPATGAPFPGYSAGKTFDEQTVEVKDLLIVSLGDSYGSGEGSPDVPQRVDALGYVTAEARWQDKRCHRSAAAPSAQAAMTLEGADPHSTVTFLSFACSGATISQPYFGDQSSFDPYRIPPPGGFTKPRGTGILGPYIGTEPPMLNGAVDYRDEVKLPSQIDQLQRALTNGGQLPARHISALSISGGGNDMGFGPLASVCTLYYECPEHFVDGARAEGRIPLKRRFQQSLDTMPDRYAAMAQALDRFTIGKVYVTQYPDPTTDSSGALCSAILDDVIPGWMQPFLAAAAVVDFSPVPGAPFRMDRADQTVDHDEVAYAANVVLPGMNGEVRKGANANGWTLVDGIADETANLFSGHGYCASDSWIRRAADATYLQGPWDPPLNCNMVSLVFTLPIFIAAGCLPPATTETTGTLHPTADGYRAIAGRLVAKMRPDLLPPPPTAPPTVTDNRAASRQGANGWLTGKGAGQNCPTGLADCVVVDLTVATDPATVLRAVGLTRDGTTVECSDTGVTTNGLTCQSRLVNSTTHTWTLTFREDGIYRVEAVGTARNGTVATSNREYKVDLHDPVSATATPTAANPETAGWFRDPVEVTFGGADAPGGSGVQEIEYQLDGGPARRAGGVQVDADGVHTVTYRPVDLAGRLGPVSTLTVRVDRSAPAVNCGAADGAWHAADVSIPCTGSDPGSGLAQAGDASFTLSTTVAAGTEPADAPTATRQVCDVAGNCSTAGPVGGNHVDKKAPTVTVASPAASGRYHLDQAVTATYSCADAGSGLATGSCRGTVPNGSAVDTSSTGRKELTVEAADNAGNAETVRVAYEVTRRLTAVTYDGPVTGDYHDPVTVSARLVDTSANPAAAVAGVELRFSLGTAGCRATTDPSGRAACTLTPDQAAGPASLQVAFDGNPRFEPSSTSAAFTVTREQTTLAYGGPTVIANKGGVRLAATLLEEGATAIAGRSVTFTVGTGPGAQSCIGATNGAGTAECTIATLNQPLGPGTVTAGFAGDGFYVPATASASTMLFEYLAQGAFVIAGDGVAEGRPATFWGSQWAKDNAGPSSFKGYAPTTDPAPPACGGTWTSSGGNTSPPASLPAYMAVAVSGDVTKGGSEVGGRITKVAVVRTDAGYTPDPATPGTGTVVATVCGS